MKLENIQFSIENHSLYQRPDDFKLNEKVESIDVNVEITELLKMIDPSPHRVLNLKYRNKCKRNTVYPLCITGTQIEVYLSQRHEY